jgi:hypothetical protein
VARVVERLVGAWLGRRREGEPIQQFFTRLTDEELSGIGLGAGRVPMEGAASHA